MKFSYPTEMDHLQMCGNEVMVELDFRGNHKEANRHP